MQTYINPSKIYYIKVCKRMKGKRWTEVNRSKTPGGKKEVAKENHNKHNTTTLQIIWRRTRGGQTTKSKAGKFVITSNCR